MVAVGVLAILVVLVVILVAVIFTALTRGLRSPSSGQTSQPRAATRQSPAQPRPLIDPTLPMSTVPPAQVPSANQDAPQEAPEEEPMPHNATFATLIACIDGRVQRPLSEWVRVQAQTDYVDTITIPGPDQALLSASPERLSDLRQYVEISIDAHGSRFIAIAGHAECAANPVSPEDHQRMIRLAVEVVQHWDLRDAGGQPVRVVGLWVDERWQVEAVTA